MGVDLFVIEVAKYTIWTIIIAALAFCAIAPFFNDRAGHARDRYRNQR